MALVAVAADEDDDEAGGPPTGRMPHLSLDLPRESQLRIALSAGDATDDNGLFANNSRWYLDEWLRCIQVRGPDYKQNLK